MTVIYGDHVTIFNREVFVWHNFIMGKFLQENINECYYFPKTINFLLCYVPHAFSIAEICVRVDLC